MIALILPKNPKRGGSPPRLSSLKIIVNFDAVLVLIKKISFNLNKDEFIIIKIIDMVIKT